MKNKKILIVCCIPLILVIALGGCRPARRPVPDNRQQAPVPDIQSPREMDNESNRNMGTPLDDGTLPRTTESTRTEGDLMARADKIVDAVTKLDEVRRATVIISEQTAVVGVKLENSRREDIDRDLEKKIEDVVQKTDRKIDRVAVTQDPDLFTRIENIGREAERGRPLSGFGREIEEIIRKVIPKV